MKNKIKFGVNRILVAFCFVSAFCAAAIAQPVSYYYSAPLTATNLLIAGNGVVTNLVAANYATGIAGQAGAGGWIATRGVTPADLNANGVSFQWVTAQVNTNNTPQPVQSLTATVALALDDASMAAKWPVATNSLLTVTASVYQTTNNTAYISFVSATNFLGAKWFKVINLSYAGTNNLNLVSARAGFWY